MTFLARLAAAALALGALAGPALAHPEHDEPRMALDQASLETRAKSIVGALIERKIVEPSWATVPAADVQQRAADGAPQQVVVFRNPAVKDPAKRVLYVVLSPYGDYVAANHTGK
jgi:hypothetical protein